MPGSYSCGTFGWNLGAAVQTVFFLLFFFLESTGYFWSRSSELFEILKIEWPNVWVTGCVTRFFGCINILIFENACTLYPVPKSRLVGSHKCFHPHIFAQGVYLCCLHVLKTKRVIWSSFIQLTIAPLAARLRTTLMNTTTPQTVLLYVFNAALGARV